MQDCFAMDFDVSEICRICLDTGELSNIFSKCIIEADLVSIPEIVKYCLDIELVELSKNFASKICKDCKLNLYQFYTFKTKSKKAEKTFYSIFEKSLKSEIVNTDIEKISVYPEPEFLNIENSEEIDDSDSVYVIQIDEEDFDYGDENDVKVDCIKNLCNDYIDNVSPDCNENEDDSNSSKKYDITEVICDENVEDDMNVEEMDNEDDKKEKQKLHLKTCHICDKTFETPNNLKRHMEAHIGLHYVCRICPKSYLHQASRNRHMREQHPVQIKKLLLQKINPFSRHDPENPPKNLNKSSKQNSSQDRISETIKSEPSTEVFDNFCSTCNESFSNSKQFIIHMKIHDFYCYICKNLFSNNEDFEIHMLDSHKLYCKPCEKHLKSDTEFEAHQEIHNFSQNCKFYCCCECYNMFNSKEEVDSHMNIKHPSKVLDDDKCIDYSLLEKNNIYKCGICGKEKNNEIELKNHVNLHSERFECPRKGCGSEYLTFPRLVIHLLSKHAREGKHYCRFCKDASFKNFDALQAHVKICKEKKFHCNHCDKNFFTSKSLRNHMHRTKAKTLMCQFCGKSFNQQSELTMHNRIHTGERPFKCSICGKTYKTSSMRAAHMDVHLNEKTYKCQLCDVKLQTRVTFRNHMKRHTVGKKHECEMCSKKFFTKYNLDLHRSRMH